MDCSPPGCFVHGISQSRILKWIAIPPSRESYWHRDGTCLSCMHLLHCRQILYYWAHQLRKGSPPAYPYYSTRGTCVSKSVLVVYCVRLFMIPWIVTCQAPLSMEFSRWKYSFSRGSSWPRNQIWVFFFFLIFFKFYFIFIFFNFFFTFFSFFF